MTNPFAVTPGPAIFDPSMSPTAGLASGIAGVIKAMEERKKLEMEKAEFESKMAYFKTLDEGNKLENEQKRRNLKKEERLLQARDQGLNAYSGWVGSGARFEDLGKIVAGIKDPEVAQDFITRATDHFKTMSQAAAARQGTAEADVSEATKGDRITQEKAQAETAQNQATITGAQAAEAPAQERAQTATTQLNAEILRRQLNAPQSQGIEPSQLNAAVNLYRTGGVTLGEAFESAGVPLPQGVNPNQKFEVQTRGMAIRKAEQRTAFANAEIANAQMEQLLGGGTKITVATRIKASVPFDAGQGAIPEDQQQLLAAGGQFASQYVLSVSGKAATDAERKFIMDQILPRAGDRPETVQQKRIMREAMVQIMYDASQGATRPLSQVIGDVIGAAKAKGATEGQVAFLRDSQKRAIAAEQQARAAGQRETPPMTAGPEPSNPDSVQAYLNSLGY